MSDLITCQKAAWKLYPGENYYNYRAQLCSSPAQQQQTIAAAKEHTLVMGPGERPAPGSFQRPAMLPQASAPELIKQVVYLGVTMAPTPARIPASVIAYFSASRLSLLQRLSKAMGMAEETLPTIAVDVEKLYKSTCAPSYGNGYCDEAAEKLKTLILEKYPNLQGSVKRIEYLYKNEKGEDILIHSYVKVDMPDGISYVLDSTAGQFQGVFNGTYYGDADEYEAVFKKILKPYKLAGKKPYFVVDP